MVKKYYIPSLPYFRDQLNEESKSLIDPKNENILVLNGEEDEQKFIDSLKKIEFVKDNELFSFFQKSFPAVAKQIKDVPIKNSDLKDAFLFIFDELPEEVFESKNIIDCLTKMLNHVIRKTEIIFNIANIENGNLLYDEVYKYSKVQNFYFELMKFNHNLETYYVFYCNTQALLMQLFVQEILFDDKKIDRKEQELLNSAFNIGGKALANFKIRLINVKNQINYHRTTLKRTNIPLPKKYNSLEKEALLKIDETIKDVDSKIKETYDSKKQLEEEVKKRHGLISKETAKEIWEVLKWLKPF